MVGVDVGFENPLFACLEIDYEEADNDPSGLEILNNFVQVFIYISYEICILIFYNTLYNKLIFYCAGRLKNFNVFFHQIIMSTITILILSKYNNISINL